MYLSDVTAQHCGQRYQQDVLASAQRPCAEWHRRCRHDGAGINHYCWYVPHWESIETGTKSSDMVPVRDVAKWRSYVNVAATLGRSIGGPLGGWLTDSIGWRWSFNGQVPPTVLGLFLILWKIPSHTNKEERDADQALLQKIRRIDFLGASLLAATISAFLLALDFASNDSPWIYISISTASFLLLLAAFYLVERGWARSRSYHSS